MIDAILHHSQQAKQHVDASLYPRGTFFSFKEPICENEQERAKRPRPGPSKCQLEGKFDYPKFFLYILFALENGGKRIYVFTRSNCGFEPVP